MRKLYLFIFLITMGLGFSQPVQAKAPNKLSGKVPPFLTAQTITFNPLAMQSYTVVDYAPGATTSSGLAVTYASSNTSVATIVSGKIHVTGVGTTIITASQAGNTTYSPAVDVTQTLTVNPAVITFAPLGSKAYASVDLALGATSTNAAVTITYTSDNAAVATIVSGKIHYVGVGTCNITAIQPAGTTYPAVSAIQSLTVTAPVITFAALGSKNYTSTDLAPGATSTNAAVAITYTSDNAAVATIIAGKIHYVGLGTANITALQPATSTYPAVSMIQPLTVIQGAAVLTLAATASRPFQTADLDPAVVSTITNTTLPVIYTSDNPAVITVVQNRLHFVGTGVTNITATQAGNNNFTAAVPVTQALTVSAPVITFATVLSTGIPLSTTDLDPATASVKTTSTLLTPINFSSDNPAVATIVNNKIHYVGIGTANITASQTVPTGAAYPAPAPVTQVLKVIQAAITLPAPGSKTFTNVDFAPGATSSIGTPPAITYISSNPLVATIVNNAIHYTGLGTSTITATQGGVVSTDASGVLTVTSGYAGSKPFNTTDLILLAGSNTSTAGIVFTSSNPAVATIVNNNVHYTGLGTTIIGATQNGVASTDVLPQTLTVTAPAITFGALGTKPFSLTDLAPGATSTLSTYPITYTSSNPEVATIVGNNIHYVGPGVTQITASQAGSGTSAYPAPADVSQTLTVSYQPLITFSTSLVNKPFSTTDLAPGATSSVVSSALYPITYTSSDPTVATIVNGNIHYVGVGSALITASQAAVPGFLAPYSQVQLLSVTPAIITLPALGVKNLSNVDLAPGATSTISTTTYPITYTSSDATVATIVNNAIHYVGPGTCTITATQATATGNYAPLAVSQTLTVTPAAITFPALGTKPFNNVTDLTLTATSSITNFAIVYTSSNLSVATIVNGAVHMIGAGTTVITASQGGVITPDVSQPLVISTPTLIFPPLGIKPFSSVDIGPGATSTISSPVIVYASSDPTVATIVNGNIHFVGLGNTTITASIGGISPDISQVLTVTPPLITFTALGAKPFNSTDLIPIATSTNQNTPVTFTSSDPTIATIVNGAIHMVANGVVTITASQAPIGNITTTPVPQVLTITLPAITFAATATKQLSPTDVDPGATSTLSPTVSPITYTSSNPAVATIVNNLLHFTGTGTTIITASQAGTSTIFGALNQFQTLTVTAGSQTITGTDITLIKGTPPYDYTSNIKTTSGLPLTVVVDDPSKVTLSGTNLTGLTIGYTHLTVTQPGNGNFLAATTAIIGVNVIDPSGDLVQVHPAVSPNGDGINDFLFVEGISTYPQNHLSVVNRNGVKVFEASNYDNKTNVFNGVSSRTGKKLPEGTYYYVLDFDSGYESKTKATGYFVLKY